MPSWVFWFENASVLCKRLGEGGTGILCVIFQLLVRLWLFLSKELRNKHIKRRGRCDDATEKKLTGLYSPRVHIPLGGETSNDTLTDSVSMMLSIMKEKRNLLLELMQGKGTTQGGLLGGYALSDPFYMVMMSRWGWWEALQANGALLKGWRTDGAFQQLKGTSRLKDM